MDVDQKAAMTRL